MDKLSNGKEIEEQKKYIRENFKSFDGYLTPERFKKENKLKESCRTFTDDSGNVIQSDLFYEEDYEERQRRDDFFGNYYEYIYLQELEEYEATAKKEKIELPPDTSERRVWDDEGLSETENEYYRRVCFLDYSSYDKPETKSYYNENIDNDEYDEEPLTMVEKRFLKDFNFNEDDPEIETNPSLRKYYDIQKKVSMNMLKRHMMQQIFKLLQDDDCSNECINSWYNDLVERANNEAINLAYLKGYRDGHRDGYNDCVRGKEADDYNFPETKKSGYDRFLKRDEFPEEIPF